MQNPVGALNDLCVKRKLNACFEFERIETLLQTRCILTVSSQTEASEVIPAQRFESNGRNKKEAKRSCSSAALDVLGLDIQLTKPTLSLSQTIHDAFTPQTLWKDPFFHAYLNMAREEDWVPVWIFAVSKSVTSWVQEQGKCCGVREMADLVAQELIDHPIEGLCLSQDHRWISLPATNPVADYRLPETKEQEILKAVYLPADDKSAPVEMELDSCTGLLKNIAGLLGTQIHDLNLVPGLSPKSSFLTQVPTTTDPEFAVQINGDMFRQEFIDKKLPLVEVRSPSLWSDEQTQLPNRRASWISGQSILGNAILTLTRPSRDAISNATVLKWRSFDLRGFWSFVETRLPERMYSASPIGRLPSAFHSSSDWHGPFPSYILNQYAKYTSRELQRSTSEDSDEVHVKLEIIGTGLAVDDCHKEKEIAEESASLKLLRLLHRDDVALWRLDRFPSDPEVHIVDPGHKRQPTVERNHKVKIQYRLFGRRGGVEWYLFDFDDRFVTEVAQHVILEKALVGLHINGCAEAHFPILIHGHIFDVCLYVRVLGFAGEGPSVVKLFPKPAAELRMDIVGNTLELHGCKEVLDIGCGEGRLLVHLLSTATSNWTSLIGVDISTKALNKARTILSQKKDIPNLTLFEGSLVDCGDFGVEAVTMVEVIEHLDGEPLGLVGSTVLGGIQPRVFVVTTPNWEYNSLMHAVSGVPDTGVYGRDGTPLRCSDHRFEWTRSEFENWAMELAEFYGYSVSFSGIGVLILEEEVRVETDQVGKDVGQASQMAVFIRQECTQVDNTNPREENNLKRIWSNF